MTRFPTALVLEQMVAHETKTVGLTFVPELVRAVAKADGVTTTRALTYVLAAEQAGVIELRPESGMGRLSQADRALCVRGMLGDPLSWARLR